MDVFEKIGDTIVQVGKDVTQKAKDVSGIAKLKLDIRSKEELVKEQYMEIGKIYYKRNKGKEVPEQTQFDRIGEAMVEIERMKLQILELKKARMCPSCGAQVHDTAEFCSACGAKLSVVAEEAVDEETKAAEESGKDESFNS